MEALTNASSDKAPEKRRPGMSRRSVADATSVRDAAVIATRAQRVISNHLEMGANALQER